MEGPSLNILTAELLPLVRKRKQASVTTGKLSTDLFTGKLLKEATSWGKYLLLNVRDHWFKIHFLMFGSYRINEERLGRDPNLSLIFSKNRVFHVYASAVSLLPN